MIVVADASVLVPAVADHHSTGDRVRSWLAELTSGDELHIVQTLTHLEALDALYRLVADGDLDEGRARHAARAFSTMPARRHELTPPMVVRVWELRTTLPSRAATYVALTERLGSSTRQPVVLATADEEFAIDPRLSIDIRRFST